MNRAVIFSSSVVLLLVACGGSSVAVGKTDQTDQQLQTKKDGSATGDGTTCSWADTALYEQVKASSPGAPVPTYELGDEFTSIDGCNACTCAARGIMCTVKTCEPVACDADARVCPDGTTVGRSGPKCEFVCPGSNVCTDDAKKCPDGSFVGRSGPNCEFVCPGDPPIACPAIARICPDGSTAQTGPNCEQICPTASCESIAADVNQKISAAIEAGRDCLEDAECVDVARASDCSDTCTVRMNKAKVGDVDAVRALANGGQCTQYAKQGCVLTRPACAPFPGPPKCVDKRCQ